jgi:hypothetical protein
MAYKISTRTVFAATTVGSGSAGGTSNSDPIDLRDVSAVGTFSFSYTVAPSNGAATAGTTNFTYLCSNSRNGTYIKPAGAGTVGTCIAAAGGSDILSFTPVVTPFIKIQAIVGTSRPATITANLNIR